MKNLFLIFLLGCFATLPSCKKVIKSAIDHGLNTPPANERTQYTIRQGNHYADQNGFQSVAYDELKFTAQFDSTCIYQCTTPANQEDINKLYGFSDNNAEHQQFSARFGWNWARNALRLYAYVYNNGERISQEIGAIQIGNEYTCSIRVTGEAYIFTVNKITVTMHRNSTTPKGTGYRLYPYFGGDETAPHDIRIWIREI